MFQMNTFGIPAVLPVREQVAHWSLYTLTQLTACLASIVLMSWQSGRDQTRSNRSKQPDTMTSDDVSKSDTEKDDGLDSYHLRLVWHACNKRNQAIAESLRLAHETTKSSR